MLGAKGRTRESVIGTPSAGPISDTWDNPAWTDFVSSYKEAFPDGFSAPSIFGHHYYMSAKAAMLALEEVGGGLSDGQEAFREALAKLEFTTPTGGTMRLDENRNGIVDNFVTEVFEREDGTLGNRVVKVVRDVDQYLGMDKEEFLAMGPVSRDNPSCP